MGPSEVILVIFAAIAIIFGFCICACYCCLKYLSSSDKPKSPTHKSSDIELTYMNEIIKSTRTFFKKETRRYTKPISSTDKPSLNREPSLDRVLSIDKKELEAESKLGKTITYVIEYNEQTFNDILRSISYLDLVNTEIIIQLSSPGGRVEDFSESLYLLNQLRNRVNITVYVNKVAASGGYLLACVAHKIIAGPFDEIGSIGVAATISNAKQLMDMVGVGIAVMTAGKHKATGHYASELTAEDKKHIQDRLTTTHDNFKNTIIKYRPDCKLGECAEGGVYMGQDALKYGLIDAIGNISDYYQDHLWDTHIFQVRKKAPKTTTGLLSKLMNLI
jgi:signal peptide peptidase SppA